MGLRRKEWQSIRDEEVFPIVLCSRRQAWTEGRSGLGRTQDKLGLDSIPDHQNFEQAPAVGRVLRRGGWGWRLVRWLEMLSSLQSRCFVFKVYRSGFFCALATLDVKLQAEDFPLTENLIRLRILIPSVPGCTSNPSFQKATSWYCSTNYIFSCLIFDTLICRH